MALHPVYVMIGTTRVVNENRPHVRRINDVSIIGANRWAVLAVRPAGITKNVARNQIV